MFKYFSLIGFFVIFYSVTSGQSRVSLENLVFEGAGIRGIAYCGALSEMEERGLNKGIKRVAGTSAGAIMAMAVSVGYTSHELADIIANTNFKVFNDGKYFFAGGINRTNKYFGWYRSKQFDSWLGKLIEQKTGNADITFAELHHRGFTDLFITGTCLNKQRLIVFSYETYPSMRVRDAVRISMSIPVYFEAVFITPEGKIINHPKDKQNLDVMVDGGFTGNFPIRIFDSTRYIAPSEKNSFAFNQKTVAFRIDKDAQIKNDSTNRELAEIDVNNFKTYLGAFYNMVVENLNRQSLTENDWERTVSISDAAIGPKLRKLSKTEVQELIANGRNAMHLYLQNNSNDTAAND